MNLVSRIAGAARLLATGKLALSTGFDGAQLQRRLVACRGAGRAPFASHDRHGAGWWVTAIVNDTTWSTIIGTWRPGRLELYVDGFSRASSTAAATNTSPVFGIYRRGWSFSTSQDFNGDIACFASSWTPAMVRRRQPIRSGSCAHRARCLRSLRVRHPQRPQRPAAAWSPS